MAPFRRFWSGREQGGQAVVLIAILLTGMLFSVGLAVDAGQLFVAKRTQQEAADAAAFAGAVQLYLGGTQADARVAAIADATLNGYTDGVAQTTVTVNSPPTEGNFIGNNEGIEVIIVRQVKTALVPAQSTFTSVRARTVATAAGFASEFAILALERGSGSCITVSNTGGIVVPNGVNLGGAIQANCTGTAIDLSGTGGITDALGTNAVGSVNYPARVLPAGSLVSPARVQRDPFAGFPKPPPTPVVSASSFSVPASACNAATPLQPGVYVGGIVNNQNCATVYLATGVYILKGGGFYQAASANTITNVPGGGTMLFNTHSNYGVGAPGTCGGIVADSGGKFDLTALTPAQSTQYAGMALYQDGACTDSIIIQSNGALNLHGTLYAPTAVLDIQSQSSGTIDAQLIVRAITMSSSGTLTVNYRPSSAAQTKLPALIE